MQTRRFGHTGIDISRIGLGCYGMSGAYGAADDRESIATIHRAIELGVNLLDTSASYGQGHNHGLIGRAVRDRRDRVFIHSKTGSIRSADGRSSAAGSGTPERLRAVCEQSLVSLGIDWLDVFCMSRVDPTVGIEDSDKNDQLEPDSKIGIPEVKRGLVAGGGGLNKLPAHNRHLLTIRDE